MEHILRRCFSGAQAGVLYFVLGIGTVANAGDHTPLVIKDQGGMIAGGKVTTQRGDL